MSNDNHDQEDVSKTRVRTMQEFELDHSYRLYLTMDQWILTKNDHDLVRLQRRGEGWDDGFALLLLEIMYLNLQGTRTELRDRWALYSGQYKEDAKILDLQMKATADRVVQVVFTPTRRAVKKEAY